MKPPIECALLYAALGRPVVIGHWPTRTGDDPRCSCGDSECRHIGKHPLTRACPNGSKSASTDPDVIHRWFADYPQANVSIVCGKEAGLWALDVDPRSGGDRSLVDLVRINGPLGNTLTTHTGGAGTHYFFRWPGRAVSNSVGRLGPGLDVRGQNACITCAPSLHASGGRYEWAFGRHDAPVIDAPGWLLRMVLPKPEPPLPPPRRRRYGESRTNVITRASKCLAMTPESIAGSGGHYAAMKAAVLLVRGFELCEDDALSLLVHEFNPRCQPPWSVRELQHKVKSAAKARIESGYMLNGDRQ